MRFSLLLAVLLTVSASAQDLPQSAVPAFEDAVQLANEGRNDAALAAFRQRAAINPNDRAARLWIATLHERMGNGALAEPVYRSLLLEDPANVDAMIGVASVLLDRYEAKEALEILEVAEERAPESAVVFSLLGRAHRLEGRDARAIEYFERAVAIEPSSAYRDQLETAQLFYLHRVETRGFAEQFSGITPDSHSGEVRLNYRLNDTMRVAGMGEAERKFGISDKRGGGSLEWRWTPATTLRGQALIGPDNLVIPEGDYLGEIEHTRGPATWSAGVRFFDFPGVQETVVSPALVWLASERLTIGLRYAMSWTETSLAGGQIGQSAQIGGDYRMYRRVWLHGAYAAGVENFDDFSIDMIGDFRANTLSGGVRIPLPTLTSIIGNYDYQWRKGDVNMARVTVSLQQRF